MAGPKINSRGQKVIPRLTGVRGNITADIKQKELRDEAMAQAMAAITPPDSPLRAVHISDIASELFRVFRGPGGVARRLYVQFLKAPAGSHTRTKILEIILKFALADSARSGVGGSTDVGDMSDDEIAAEEKRIMNDGMQQDLGDPGSIGAAIEVEEAIESAEAADPELLELDAEISLMERQESDGAFDSPSTKMKKAIDSLRRERGDDLEEGSFDGDESS